LAKNGGLDLLVGDGTLFAGGFAQKVDGDAGHRNGENESHDGKNGDAKDQTKANGEKGEERSDHEVVGFVIKAVTVKHDDTSRCMDL
jgi:hypothetical protein